MSEFPVVTRYVVHGAQDVIATNAKLWESFKQGETSVKDFSTSLRENMEGTYAQRRALSGIRMAIRVDWAEYMELGRALSSVGSIGRNVLSMWQAYTIGQIRVQQANEGVTTAQLGVAKAHKKAQDAQKEVTKWQKLYNQYLRDFGKDSSYTKDAYDNLGQAQEYLTDAQSEEKDANLRVAEAMERAAKALEDLKIGYASMALQAPSTIADILRIGTSLSTLFALIAAKGGGLAILARGFANLGISIAPLTALIPALAPLLTPEGFEQATKFISSWSWEDWQFHMYDQYWKDLEAKVKQQQQLIQPITAGGGSVWTHPIVGLTNEPTPSSYGVTPTTHGIIGYGQFGIPYVPETGVYMLHKGERVNTAEQTRQQQNNKLTVNMSFNVTNEFDVVAAARVAKREIAKFFGGTV